MAPIIRRIAPLLPRVAIFGRPNVGKSSLFNKLCQSSLALVDKTAGVTRDTRDRITELGHLRFVVTDTPGADVPPHDVSPATVEALRAAHIGLLVTDGRAGLMPVDRDWAIFASKYLGKDVENQRRGEMLWVVNKCENMEAVKVEDARRLVGGMAHPEPIFISAEHNIGIMSDLFDKLRQCLPAESPMNSEQASSVVSHTASKRQQPVDVVAQPDAEMEALADEQSVPEEDCRPIRIAIVGRPNVGKSTLLNQLVGEDCVLTGPTPGLTRDAIEIAGVYDGRQVIVVDTAGMQRAARRDGTRLADITEAQSRRALAFANVCVVVIDATATKDMLHPHPHREDYNILQRSLDEGRAVVVAINKCDEAGQQVVSALKSHVEQTFAKVPVVCISGRTGAGCGHLVRLAMTVYDRWRTRISTGILNRFVAGHALETEGVVKYVTQVKSRPPTFVAWCKGVPDESWQRWFSGKIREEFNLFGVPFRVKYRG